MKENKQTNKIRQGQRSKRKTLEGGRGQSVMTDGLMGHPITFR